MCPGNMQGSLLSVLEVGKPADVPLYLPPPHLRTALGHQPGRKGAQVGLQLSQVVA